jgi:hypothetical protein
LSKAARRWIIAAATFLAGLYFVLEFVVPPTLPGATTTGVVVATREGSLAVTGGRTFPISSELKVLKRRITGTGVREAATVPVRQVREGETVSIEAGEARLEDVKITAIDRGSFTLLVEGQRREVSLGGSSVVLLHSRDEQPAEIEARAVQFGQTVSIGPTTLFKDQSDTAAQFTAVIETMAIGMGLLSLAYVNGRKVRRKEGDWYTSVFFFLAVVIGVAAGLWKYYPAGTTERDFSDLVIMRVITAVGSTIFSLLAFYLASAAYRAFRVRTAEAALMMASALIVMLGQTPFGMYLTGWLGEQLSFLWLPNMAGWLLREPISAVFRGLIFGIMLGAIATALRYWLSLERSSAMGD